MKLSVYLDNQCLTQAEFAARIGVAQPSVSRYAEGRMPRAAYLRRILKATGGAVTANDFVDEDDPPRRRSKRAA